MPALENISRVGNNPLMNINWELVSHCQFKCSYCYFHPHKSETDYSSVAKLVLKKLGTVSENFKITCLGGEPSLHPDFLWLMKELHQMEKVQSIAIVTNLERPLSFWTDLLPYKEKVKIVISLHVEYPQEQLLEKIQELQKNFKLDLVFNVHPNPVYLPKMREWANLIETIVNENVIPSFMRLHKIDPQQEDDYFDYPEEIESFLNEQNSKWLNKNRYETVSIEQNGQWKDVPKFQIVAEKANRFTGWKCELKAFIIHYDGTVSLPCRQEKKHILMTDFRGKDLLCPHRFCVCDDYWSFTKTKENQQ